MQESLCDCLLVLWLNSIIEVVPVRLASTFAELLIGAVLSRSGHITDALLSIGYRKHHTTYYWMLTTGKWSSLQLNQRLVELIVTTFPRVEFNLLLDDFICPRSTDKAPHAKYHHEHSKKPNRPEYLWGQQWLGLSLSISWGGNHVALPIFLRLHKSVGNSTKLSRGVMLIKFILPILQKAGKTIRVLVDSWYMKAPFVLPLLMLGLHVIGQARKDTALFESPLPTTRKTRGRPRKYGDRWTPERVKTLPVKTVVLNVYGSCKDVKYRSVKCLARFLNGHTVTAVWCQLPKQKSWSLILSTDLTLTPERIIKLYARRWRTEPMFNEIKHAYGVAQAWQQKSRTLHRWVTILCTAYSLTRMLALVIGQKKNENAVPHIAWRQNSPVTAGLMRKGIQLFFCRFTFSMLWQSKYKKLMIPKNNIST
jgi:hypothetical protein